MLDKAKFPDTAKLVSTLADTKTKLIAYIDAAVNVQDRSKNPTYTSGKTMNAFIQSTIEQQNPDGYLVNQKQGK